MTPRTTSATRNDLHPTLAVVPASLARELETELSAALADLADRIHVCGVNCRHPSPARIAARYPQLMIP